MSGALDVQLCDRLLTTTRSLRKRLDLTKDVPTEIIEECLDIAVQSPTGTNTQKWHFVVVRNSDKRKQVAEIYKKAFELYWADIKKRSEIRKLSLSQLKTSASLNRQPIWQNIMAKSPYC